MTIFADPLSESPAQGHNQPPSAIDDARAAYQALSDFLAQTPIIADEKDAKLAKLYLDRTNATLKDVDAAKEAEANPLHEKWKAALAKFKPASDSLTKLLDELKARMTAYAKAEKAKKEQIAREAAAKAAEAERLAREAEAKETEAAENAKQGEFTDVGAATVAADEAFASFQRESRFAARAEKATNVRFGGGFAKAAGLRTVKTLVLDDAIKAIAVIGPDEGITAAILTAARAYRKTNGTLPNGVTEISEEKI
jgi:hypothetical protein